MRQLIRQRKVVADDWRYSDEQGLQQTRPEQAGLSDAGADGSAVGLRQERALIFPLQQWLAERQQWWLWDGKLGVRIGPTDDVAVLEHDFLRVSLVAIEFGGMAEGRGYSQAQLLRSRYRFTGELRAVGKIQRDQVFYMARCGFDSFEFPPGTDLNAVLTAFGDFTVAYQGAADGTVQPARRRLGASSKIKTA
jgi:uncharacterized protein (DUF934 family)